MKKQKLNYQPEQGMITRKTGEWEAPDGSQWYANGGYWVKTMDAPGVMNRKGAWAYFLFGFFVALACFAKPVGMTFPNPAAGIPVLIAISFIVGAFFVRFGTSAGE